MRIIIELLLRRGSRREVTQFYSADEICSHLLLNVCSDSHKGGDKLIVTNCYPSACKISGGHSKPIDHVYTSVNKS